MNDSFRAYKGLQTEKGSIYQYLSDGRTMRIKVATQEIESPMDVLVFIPPLELLIQNNHPQIGNLFGDTEHTYQQAIRDYIFSTGRKCYVLDGNRKLNSNEEVEEANNPTLALCDKQRVDARIPVTGIPQLGYQTFDTRKYVACGQSIRESHLGNKVIDIF